MLFSFFAPHVSRRPASRTYKCCSSSSVVFAGSCLTIQVPREGYLGWGSPFDLQSRMGYDQEQGRYDSAHGRNPWNTPHQRSSDNLRAPGTAFDNASSLFPDDPGSRRDDFTGTFFTARRQGVACKKNIEAGQKSISGSTDALPSILRCRKTVVRNVQFADP